MPGNRPEPEQDGAAIGIRRVEAGDVGVLDGLCTLLRHSVDQGASVGFLAPLSQVTALAYWEHIVGALGPELVLWVAEDRGRVVGSVQLSLCGKENGRHRAEVQKLLVHSRHRNQGLGRSLMDAIEHEAQQRGITLLVLDTIEGETAEQLYLKLGYVRVGEIPNYASFPDGRLWATVIFYKEL
jgi:ribosomal protein S18 acetylase RimI-like enzyme